MLAELFEIEFELSSDTGIVWYLIEYMYLMLYVLDILQRRE